MKKFKKLWMSLFSGLITIVNISTYLVMTFGFFRGLYYSFYKLNWSQFIVSIIMTLFATYINLKNPNN